MRLAFGSVLGDVVTQHCHEFVREIDDPLAPVLRRDDGDVAAVPLELTRDRHLTPQEVDISNLDPGRFAHPKAGERA